MTAPACPDPYRDQFEGTPRYKRLERGERLYKFVSIPINRTWIMASPWWIPESAFDRLRGRMRAERRALNEIARDRYAIARRWNPGMDGLFVITIGSSVDAWRGAAKPQTQLGAGLVGGDDQVCVPNLTWRDVAIERAQVPFFQTGA